MSEKKNEREKKEGGLGRDGVVPPSPCFFLSVCLLVSRLFFFSPVPTYRESETATRNILERSKMSTTINFFLETEKKKWKKNEYNQFKRNKSALF